MQLAHSTDMLCSCAHVQVVLLLQRASMDAGAWPSAFVLCGRHCQLADITFLRLPNAHVSANRLFGPNSKQRDFKGVAVGFHCQTGFEDEVCTIMLLVRAHCCIDLMKGESS